MLEVYEAADGLWLQRVTTLRRCVMLHRVSTTSRVWVYAVDDQGATGPLVGTGALVAPKTIVVRAPLSTALARSHAVPRLRVGITSTAGDLVEVLDPGDVLVLRSEEGPLVALTLAVPARSPADQVAGLDDAEDEQDAARAMQAHLAGRTDPDVSALFAGEEGQSTDPPSSDDVEPEMEASRADKNPLCMLFGHRRWCGHPRGK